MIDAPNNGRARALGNLMNKFYTLFLTFSCGHDFFMDRESVGMDPSLGLCNSCQPYHARITVNHPCGLCGGSFRFFKDAPQTIVEDCTAEQNIREGTPLLGNDRRGENPPQKLDWSKSSSRGTRRACRL